MYGGALARSAGVCYVPVQRAASHIEGPSMSETEQSQSEAVSTSASGREPKVIKRYTNRKLYDTVESRYVTLDEIAEMVKQGTEVRIVDNKSKEDLTSVTLAQIIFEEEKKKNRMPLSVLREIIRHPGESISEFISREVQPRMASLREEAESRLGQILGSGAGAGGEGEGGPKLLESSQRLIEDWKKGLDEKVRQAVENVAGSFPAFGRDLEALTQRLESLEKRLRELESKKE
jgi:polyhydroxyalkanoate synthesis repressor PhaR